ncbi:UNVERIFIED_CONTAM: hypothetical protein Sradi_5888400 [Sesamum radiatum]|uniref:Uncharacterized protein n=1 Tax=Sesamum radiatum TaxID=300843 RepID=A0AAW2KUQ9_SESRA
MADPANTKLGRMLLDEITPVVMVLRTPLVEESCRKNGFSLIEMLAPFSNFNNIDVPVRTASDQPYRLRKFRLRLFYGSEVRQPNIEKIGPSGGRNATRCGIWWAEMLKARDQFKDAAGVYFRISGEEPLHSAVMLEQASYCFLLSTPTMLRKYGFHLVLSGDLYRKCDQETGKTYEVLRLQLPVINFPLIKVVFEDHRTYASTAAHAEFFLMYCFLFSPTKIILSSDIGGGSHIFSLWKLPSANTGLASVRESLWKSLEEDMIPSLSVMKTNWLESQQKVLPKKYKESNVCVCWR